MLELKIVNIIIINNLVCKELEEIEDILMIKITAKLRNERGADEEKYIDAALFVESDVDKQFSFMHIDGTLFDITVYIDQNH